MKQEEHVHSFADDVIAPSAPETTADTCTMLMTTPNALMKPIHDRMPVVVLAEDWERWLDPAVSDDDVSHLLKPAPAGFLETWPVLDMTENPEVNGGHRSDIPEDHR